LQKIDSVTFKRPEKQKSFYGRLFAIEKNLTST